MQDRPRALAQPATDRGGPLASCGTSSRSLPCRGNLIPDARSGENSQVVEGLQPDPVKPVHHRELIGVADRGDPEAAPLRSGPRAASSRGRSESGKYLRAISSAASLIAPFHSLSPGGKSRETALPRGGCGSPGPQSRSSRRWVLEIIQLLEALLEFPRFGEEFGVSPLPAIGSTARTPTKR